MPAAKNSRPSPASRSANDWESSPNTAEVFTPAFSKTAPPSKIRVEPPPPPSRTQRSSRKLPSPSVRSRARQISSCSEPVKATMFPFSNSTVALTGSGSVDGALGFDQDNRPELGFELGNVVLHRNQKALHVLGVGDDPRAHPRLGLLGSSTWPAPFRWTPRRRRRFNWARGIKRV